MRLATVALLLACVGVLCFSLVATAATVTSSFTSGTFAYDYTVTPATGESIKDFHVFENRYIITVVILPEMFDLIP